MTTVTGLCRIIFQNIRLHKYLSKLKFKQVFAKPWRENTKTQVKDEIEPSFSDLMNLKAMIENECTSDFYSVYSPSRLNHRHERT
jgi:hypothetical protein